MRYLADRVVVMYLGRIMEQGTTDEVFSPPYHPYTEALLSAVPIADTAIRKKHIVLEGEIPSAVNLPTRLPVPHPLPPQDRGDLRDRGAAARRSSATGHTVFCHIPSDQLRAVEPVFAIGRAARPARGRVTPALTAAARVLSWVEPGRQRRREDPWTTSFSPA